MRILFIVPYLPSLIRVRPYNLIRALYQRDHQITLLALFPNGDDASGLSNLGEWCQSVHLVRLPRWQPLWNALRALPSTAPFQAAYSWSPHFTRLLRSTLAEEQYDVIHLEHLRGAELTRGVNTGTLPIVFDAVDSISLLFERTIQGAARWQSRLIAKLDLNRTRRYEAQYMQRFSRVLVTAPEDRDALAALASKEGEAKEEIVDRLVVLPNGVDLTYFRPLHEPVQPDTVIFSGKMSYHANTAAALDLVRSVMPVVWVERPETKVWLVGKDPPNVVRKLAADPRVTVTGTVSDIRSYLGRAAVAVSPLRYSVGIQNKVLEAMAMGTPVVATPTACRALAVESDVHLRVGDSPEALARAILSLLASEEQRDRLGKAGRAYVETHHDWERIVDQLASIYEQVVDASVLHTPF